MSLPTADYLLLLTEGLFSISSKITSVTAPERLPNDERVVKDFTQGIHSHRNLAESWDIWFKSFPYTQFECTENWMKFVVPRPIGAKQSNLNFINVDKKE